MENTKFLGKFLIRKARTKNGTENLVTITGVFRCENSEILHDNDEMWVAELKIVGPEMIKYKDIIGKTSPEDFLEGIGQSPKSWKIKEKINL